MLQCCGIAYQQNKETFSSICFKLKNYVTKVDASRNLWCQ